MIRHGMNTVHSEGLEREKIASQNKKNNFTPKLKGVWILWPVLRIKKIRIR